MAPEIQPVLDPADHALMLTPDQLRNQSSKNVNVSFLRKTQYMTSQNARANDGFMRPNSRASKPANRSGSVAEPQILRDDPINIKRHIQKGFDIAYPESTSYNQPDARGQNPTATEREAWRTPTHPDNPRLKPLSYYPLVPDLDASTDTIGYLSIKFDKPPLPSQSGHRDDRVDVAMLNPVTNASVEASWQARVEAYEKNPGLYDDPGPQPFEWDFYIPKASGVASGVKRKFNDADPDKNDEELYDGLFDPTYLNPEPGIDYVKARSYGAVAQDVVNPSRYMAVSLFDPETAGPYTRLRGGGRAAYYYPINQRLRIKADRGKVGPKAKQETVSEGAEADAIKVVVRDPTAVEMATRAQARKELDPTFLDEFERLDRLAEEEKDGQTSAPEEEGVRSELGDETEMAEPPSEEAARAGQNGFVEHAMDDD